MNRGTSAHTTLQPVLEEGGFGEECQAGPYCWDMGEQYVYLTELAVPLPADFREGVFDRTHRLWKTPVENLWKPAPDSPAVPAHSRAGRGAS
ncbi:hypothetical protein GCM10010466_38080 [Planomonospora alba]|uniref:Uncharacterized protein n=1 Tax=Planomonospora alba TaxID=161354 RepID=A0ABP6NC96_9ACTN